MRIGLLWREEWDPVSDAANAKVRGVFRAFADLGVAAEPVVFTECRAEEVRDQLAQLDGVLVWVNPIERGLDRSVLDELLREAPCFVSAHPNVILRLGTKQVLADTQRMSWGTETHVHESAAALRGRLDALDGPKVLKQHRGMGGDGVWKVELVEPGTVEVQHAAAGAAPERLSVDDFVARCTGYFAGEGRMVEQPFQSRLEEGMTRVYMTHDRVVGFAHQYPRGLMPPDWEPPSSEKRFLEVDAFPDLRTRMETEWAPELMRLLDLRREELPVIWDADFLRGDDGDYVLCEINCSSTFAFPEHAMPGVARATLALVG